MTLSDFGRSESQFLSKTDLPKPPSGIRCKIVEVGTHVFQNESRQRLVLEFNERTKDVHGDPIKPLVLNVTNVKILQAIFPDITDEKQLVGRVVELFNDVSVSFNGDIGGIRIRPDSKTVPHPEPVEDDPTTTATDDIPF